MNNTIKKIETIGLFSNFLMIIGAFSGSVIALVPKLTDSVGLDTTILKYSPFKTFIIPGLFLLIILCGGNLINSFLFIKRKKDSPYFLVLMGAILILWLFIQCIFIWDIAPPHIIFLLVGIVQVYCGMKLILDLSLPLPFKAKQN